MNVPGSLQQRSLLGGESWSRTYSTTTPHHQMKPRTFGEAWELPSGRSCRCLAHPREKNRNSKRFRKPSKILHQPTIKFTGFLPINFLPLLAPPYPCATLMSEQGTVVQVGVLTVSDRVSRGEAEDVSGPLAVQLIEQHLEHAQVTPRTGLDESNRSVDPSIRPGCGNSGCGRRGAGHPERVTGVG